MGVFGLTLAPGPAQRALELVDPPHQEAPRARHGLRLQLSPPLAQLLAPFLLAGQLRQDRLRAERVEAAVDAPRDLPEAAGVGQLVGVDPLPVQRRRAEADVRLRRDLRPFLE